MSETKGSFWTFTFFKEIYSEKTFRFFVLLNSRRRLLSRVLSHLKIKTLEFLFFFFVLYYRTKQLRNPPSPLPKKPNVPPHDAIKAKHWAHNKVKVFDFAAGIMLDLTYFLECLRNFSLMKYQKFPGGFAPWPPIFSVATILKSLPGHYLGKIHPQVTR